MSISAGTRLGPYEVLAPIGSGGMGEVYRARDTKLGRDVALKVLPEAVAHDADRMARFEREAQVLASLNHPNIAAIHGLEESTDIRALVMELVEGPTLAERIGGRAMPLEEVLPIAKQIGDALEYAHEKGIIHRDLKPANVKLTADGNVKVLDFGLAKALEAPAQGAANPSISPTLTIEGTRAGVIMGTAAYMAPEQARGAVVDKRADIWSFGVVLYEMLMGKQPFEGATVSDTLASVLKTEPDLTLVPVQAQKLLRRCLDKDPKRRLRDIGEARFLLDEAPAPQPLPPRAGWLWPGIAAVVGIIAAPLLFIHFRETPTPTETMRFQISPTANVRFTTTTVPVVSPDGRRIAFKAVGSDGIARLWVRSVDSIDLQPLEGTEGTSATLAWSPDSRLIAFGGGDGKLKKVSISGGPPQPLCDAPQTPIVTAWNRDGVILFGSRYGPLFQVSQEGGAATAVTALSEGEAFHGFPSFLPDGRHFLYVRSSRLGGVYLGSIDVKPLEQNSNRLLPTDIGGSSLSIPSPYSGVAHILFLRGGSLMAQTFDTKRLELVGEPTVVAGQVGDFDAYGYYSGSTNDILAYRTAGGANTQLLWFDRQGKNLGAAGEPGRYIDVALSPDGKQAATTQRGQLIWLLDLSTGTSTRLTFGLERDGFRPVWSPDGRRIAFASAKAGPADLYQKDASGAREEELLFHSDLRKFPNDWSRDGRFLLYNSKDSKTNDDLWVLPLEGDRKPMPYLTTKFNESQGQFSPDGHWVAYQSDESGTAEIFVRPFPAPTGAGKWIISRGGGKQPRWRLDGKELFYISLDDKLMAVDLLINSGFKAGIPHVLFQTQIWGGTGSTVFSWDRAADGKRFLINTEAGEGASAPITVVVNWTAGLKK